MSKAWYYVTGLLRDEYDPEAEGEEGMACFCEECSKEIPLDYELWPVGSTGTDFYIESEAGHSDPCFRCMKT